MVDKSILLYKKEIQCPNSEPSLITFPHFTNKRDGGLLRMYPEKAEQLLDILHTAIDSKANDENMLCGVNRCLKCFEEERPDFAEKITQMRTDIKIKQELLKAKDVVAERTGQKVSLPTETTTHDSTSSASSRSNGGGGRDDR